MFRNTMIYENLNGVHYSIEKCRKFFSAQDPEKSLSALRDVSQLVYLLPDELVEKIIQVALHKQDFRIRIEACYLANRWGKIKKKELSDLLENDTHQEVREYFEKLPNFKKISFPKVIMDEDRIDFLQLDATINDLLDNNAMKEGALQKWKENLLGSFTRNLIIFIGSMVTVVVFIGLLVSWAVSNETSSWLRFCTSFTVSIIMYEIFLIGRKCWKIF